MILRKLLVTAFLLIAVALGSADFFITRYTAERELHHAAEVMEAQARLIKPVLASVETASLGTWVQQAAQQSDARVTVIGRDGLVLADSQHDASTMDNHAGRPEIRQALAGQTGQSVRHSATLDIDFCYLAVPAELREKPGIVLRLAVPLEQVSVSIANIRWLIFRATLIAAVVTLAIAFFVSRSFTRRIRRIQAFAQELVNAEYSGTLATEADDELGSVVRSLRGMAERFRDMLRRLADESARRKAILASMVEGVLAVDRDLRVTFCNESFARAVQTRQPAPEGLPMVEMARDPELLDLMKQILATGSPKRTRLTLISARGRVFDAQAALLEGQERPGAIAIFHDVTEIERLERVRKDFIANISHELRTPLAAIRGYAETLLDRAPENPEERRKFLEIICSNATRLGGMAADLLALAELDAEQKPPAPEKVSVLEAATAAIATVQWEAKSRQVKIVLDTGEDLYIMGQPFRLEHALLNLLNNAIRYSRAEGQVRVETAKVNDEVRIAVRDTGLGIPPSDLPRIFERFYCVDKARARETGGTGLGLSIVKHLVESMDGTISVESRIGKGTVFTMNFPSAV
jgi:two-component system, OmpR family, phosphate regulon sensor histidine kinase PhoR